MPSRTAASSSSMYTASSLGSSWLESSPSRHSPSRNAIRSPARDVARRTTLDKESPSRQMMLEFSQMLIRSDEDFTSRLDQAAAEHAQLHLEQLSKAALEHEKIRVSAELERKRLVLEQELQQRKREEKQREEVDRIEREKAKQEAEARQRQIKREEEEARRATEQQRLIKEAEAKVKAQKEQQDAVLRQKAQQEDAARKAKEGEAAKTAAAEQARTQAISQPTPTKQLTQVPALPAPVVQKSTLVAGAANVEELHSRYLELHQRMKAFWKPFRTECAQKDNPLKGPVGDLRRDMRTATGQVTVKREDSKIVITKLREMLRRSRDAGGPTLDIRPFIVSHQFPAQLTESEAQYPAILLYAFVCFEKFIMKQFEQEAANEDGRIIQELGAIAASLFLDKEFSWNGLPLIDLLLAKFHRICPILFGINGNMNTTEGRARLGLPVDFNPKKPNSYHQRMLGMGCGYAALALRPVATPAIPISEYWRALATITNTASQEIYSGHLMVLKGLLRDSAPKFLRFYGVHGKAVLRQATIVLPGRAPTHAKDAAEMVAVLLDVWKAVGITLE